MKSILVVEDNQNNQLVIQDYFRRHKQEYQLDFMNDGLHLMTYAKETPPDLILLDIRLPGLSGWELAKLLKSDQETKHIPIIAVTAHAMKGSEEVAKNAGCDDFITKPIQRKILLAKIQQWLNTSTSEGD